MRAQLLKYWERIRSSFWFLPSLMAAAAVGLSFFTVALDQSATQKWLRRLDWVYNGGTEGASAVLQTIAGSMITMSSCLDCHLLTRQKTMWLIQLLIPTGSCAPIDHVYPGNI